MTELTDHDCDLALTESVVLLAACAYVDGSEGRAPIGDRKRLWENLREAVAAYRAVSRQPLPEDHEFVEQGMRVVRRLLDQEATP